MSECATLDSPRSASIERRVGAFEAAHAAGGSVDLLRFIPPVDHPNYLVTVCELIRVGLELGWATGRPERAVEYRAQFPEVFARRELADAVAFEEERLRARYGMSAARAPDIAATARVNVPVAAASSDSASAFHNGTRERPALPAVGDEFLGFRLAEELGTGSFGRVYLAHQQALSDRPVALKLTTRPTREAQHLARLQHTNIVPVLSVHQAGGVQAVCMPYYGRTTLRQVLGSIRRHQSLPASGEGLVSTLRASAHATVGDSRRTPAALPAGAPQAPDLAAIAPTPTRDMLARLGYVDAVVWLGARLADGLAHAHERGVLHRDLKPENVLLADDGQPMLLDFNLAEDAPDGAPHCGGTPLYMAPEHLAAFVGDRARPVDARSDLYALGLVLYELLTTRHPSPLAPRGTGSAADSPIKTLLAARSVRPEPVRRWNPAVSPAVAGVVERLLDPDPARRYQTARQLQEDLERHLANLPLKHGREPSVRERARKFTRRHPRAIPLAGMAGVVAVSGWLASAVLDRTRAREQAEGRAAESARREAVEREAVEASARFRRFAQDIQTARVLLTTTANDPKTQAAGAEQARAALAGYAAGANWDEQPNVRLLPEKERAALRADTAEAFLLLEQWAAREGRTDDARDFARRADALAAPDSPARTAYLDGAAKAVAGKWADAVPPLERACRLAPQHFAAMSALGFCFQMLGRDAEALECYRAVVALRPDFPWVYVNRGLIYQQRGSYDLARADYDEAVRLGPTWHVAYFTRGALLQQMGKNELALADFNTAEELKSPRARLFLLRSQVKAQLKDAKGSAKDRARAFATPPADEFDHLAFGVAYLAKEPEKALAEFDRALALNPRSWQALMNRAHVLADRLERGPEAVKTLDTLVAQYPTYAKAWGGRAVVHARLGDRAAAHRDAAECLRRDTAPRTLYQLAGVYALTSKGAPGDDRREALRLLAAAFTAGFRDFATLDRDDDLDPVRGTAEFVALVREFRAGATSEKK